MTLEDLIRMGSGGVSAVGQGGSRNPYAVSGYTPRAPQGADYMQQLFGLGHGSKVYAVGQGGSRTPQTGAEAIQMLYGVGDGGHPQQQAPTFAPSAPIPQYFGNDWSGMRRNIGMPVGGGLAGMAGALGGAMGGQPQRSPFGFGGAGATLGSLLGMYGGGRH